MRRLTAALFLVVSACSTASLGPVGSDQVDDPAGDSPAATPPAASQDDELAPVEVERPETRFDGEYQVTTDLDLAASGMLGDRVGGTLVLLSELHDNPAGTILGLLALYDVPIVSTIYDLLPGFLEDELEGWLNDAVFDAVFDGVPAVEAIAELVDGVASISRDVDLTTDLTLGRPNAGGGIEGHHRLVSMGFHYESHSATIPIPSIVGDVTEADPHARLRVVDSRDPGAPDGLLEIEAHTFGIPYGEMLMSAIAEFIYAPLGVSSLGELLNTFIDCGAIAAAVGDHCVWGGCISDFVSTSDLESLCTTGLDLVGDMVEDDIRSMSFDLVSFDLGRCEMYDVGYDDTAGDFTIDALAGGEWTSHVTMNGSSYLLHSPFEGRRIGE